MRHRSHKRPEHTAVPVQSDHEIRQARREHSRWKFGRDPGPEDPTFIHHDTVGPRLMTDAEIDAAAMATRRLAGIQRELIHAYHRCGFLLTEEPQMSTAEAQAAWLTAIAEHHSATPSGTDA
jgi:hypothetical protein